MWEDLAAHKQYVLSTMWFPKFANLRSYIFTYNWCCFYLVYREVFQLMCIINQTEPDEHSNQSSLGQNMTISICDNLT